MPPFTPEPAHRDSQGSSEIEAVRTRHEGSLMAISGVLGVSIGRSPIGDPAIVVFIEDASVEGRIPVHLEGFPVLTTITGRIDASGTPR